VKTIQAAYRRFLFRKKLEIMKLCYFLYLKEREEQVCNFLRKAFWNYSCKIKRDYLVFLKYRVNRMVEIKENLAILTIKKIWRAKKFSFKIIKEKFIRIKRRRAAMQNKEAYQKYLATLGGAAAAPKKPETREKKSGSNSKDSKNFETKDEKSHENPEEDEEYKEAQRIKDIIEKKIKEKVSKSKMAYAIRGQKTKALLPMMQEKALAESLDNEAIASKLFYLTKSVFAKGRSLDRDRPDTTRNLQIYSPRAVSQRKHYDGTILPPLFLGSLAEAPLEEAAIAVLPKAENEHFLISTVSSLNKTEEPIIPQWKLRAIERAEAREADRKRTRRVTMTKKKNESDLQEGKRVTREFKAKERVYPWIPVARRFSSYVPGIDNSGYVPLKWSPLPLNKRILTAQGSPGVRERQFTAMAEREIGSEEVATDRRNRNRRVKDTIGSFSPSTQEQSVEFTSFN
jgi:hypothetical protein